MAFRLSPAILGAAQIHARAEYPREACGLVVGDAYWPCENVAADPFDDFEISPAAYLAADATGDLAALIHSHPNGPNEPSGADRQGQEAMALPWVILPLDAHQTFEPIVFGTLQEN